MNFNSLVYGPFLSLLFQSDTSMEWMVEELVALSTHGGLLIIYLVINFFISIHQALFQLARVFFFLPC